MATSLQDTAPVRLTGQSGAGQFRLGHHRSLDGLRGISVLAVMAYHAGLKFADGGFLGVDLFFVLSGFLITTLLIQEWQATGTVSLRRFYLRRVLRLMPALLGVLLAVGLHETLSQPPERWAQSYKNIGTVLIYLSNWVRIWYGPAVLGLLGHTWSLSIEEQFYLLWPPALRALLRLRWGRGCIVLMVVGGIAASACVRAVLAHQGSSVERLYNGTDTRADALLTGALAGLLVSWRLIPQAGWVRSLMRASAVAAAIGIGLLGVTSSLHDQFLYSGGLTLVALGAATLILRLTDTPRGVLAWATGGSVLTWLGRLSYGLYLWHYPIFRVVRELPISKSAELSLEFGLTFLAAALSFYGIERPFLRLKSRLA